MLTSMLLAFLASHNSADALERFGEQQEKLATEKEAAKQKVLNNGPGSGATPGSATGSAGSLAPMTPLETGSGATTAPATSGPAGASPGSTTTPATGSAAAPAEAAPPAAGSATKPAETKPAETKPAETKPAETKPATGSAAK
jgi:hypothetical protein